MEVSERKLIVTQTNSHYNRITITREEIRLKLSKSNSRELDARLLKAGYGLLPEETLQTFRGQLDCDRGVEAESIQMYTGNRGKAFKLYI